MSLNKTLDRLFDEIRREAKRNPEFADRLDAVLRLHDSRRDVADDVIEGVASEAPAPAAAPTPPASSRQKKRAAASAPAPAEEKSAGKASAAPLNPVGLFKREGEDALTIALAALDEAGLRAMIAEHNLDPSGETESQGEAELATHIIAQAKRRAERDDKMFDY
jgi:hypothetical protein